MTASPRTQLRTLSQALLAREQALSVRYYRVSEIAFVLGVRPATIRKWIHEKRVVAVRTGRAGRLRIAESELKKLQQGQEA
jgi:excisionase family DNA binding protein